MYTTLVHDTSTLYSTVHSISIMSNTTTTVDHIHSTLYLTVAHVNITRVHLMSTVNSTAVWYQILYMIVSIEYTHEYCTTCTSIVISTSTVSSIICIITIDPILLIYYCNHTCMINSSLVHLNILLHSTVTVLHYSLSTIVIITNIYSMNTLLYSMITS